MSPNESAFIDKHMNACWAWNRLVGQLGRAAALETVKLFTGCPQIWEWWTKQPNYPRGIG